MVNHRRCGFSFCSPPMVCSAPLIVTESVVPAALPNSGMRPGARDHPARVLPTNKKALDEMSDGVAHATLAFAQTTSAVSGTEKGSGSPSSELKYKGPMALR